MTAPRRRTDALAIDPTPRFRRSSTPFARGPRSRSCPPNTGRSTRRPQITRGELAALIGVRLAPLLQPDRRVDAEPITDVRGDWAASWILAVARAGVMEPFANHAFQPRTVVRRIDLAQAVERLLSRIAPLKPAAAKAWESTRWPFPDLAPSHLAYPAASWPSRPVS